MAGGLHVIMLSVGLQRYNNDKCNQDRDSINCLTARPTASGVRADCLFIINTVGLETRGLLQ